MECLADGHPDSANKINMSSQVLHSPPAHSHGSFLKCAGKRITRISDREGEQSCEGNIGEYKGK
ncbi:hypothetical protein E2C01_076511 [Portunus trituberculatus]|uniref:Uncharacterized protein n=1 Tax=Portunus trituberculatus TaxID=210409 RepID=A0A5B7IHU8_PORTR|nr:hypothetical protein [Portunus trituberculatus]